MSYKEIEETNNEHKFEWMTIGHNSLLGAIVADLDVLQHLASKVDSITELGVEHAVSTYAWLAGKPKKVTSIDIRKYPQWKLLRKVTKDIDTDFSLIVANDIAIELEEVDLLFIDSLHTYDHVKKQLEMHAHVVNKYIVFHDILMLDGTQHPQPVPMSLRRAAQEFLTENKNWKRVTVKRPCGLFIIEKTN